MTNSPVVALDLNAYRPSEQFKLALEAAPTGMLMIDRAGKITLLNHRVEALFGYTSEELLGKPIEILIPPNLRSRHPEYRAIFFGTPRVRAMGAGRDLYGQRKDGTEIPVEIGLTPLRTADGDFVLSSIVDISLRKHSEEQFRLALEAAPTGMLMVDDKGCIALVNAQIEKLFGYSRDELIGTPVELLVPERFRGRHAGFRRSFYDAPQTRVMGAGRDLYGLRKDGSEVPVEIGLNPLDMSGSAFVLSSIVDITERKRSLEQLRQRSDDLAATLKEREVLLQEIHHRVKNNLQVISSLINMQVRKLGAHTASDVLKECKSRIEAIGLIHEKLYQSRDYARVPFSEYARSLASNVLHAADASSAIVLQTDLEPIVLPVDKAIPCGLILNELILNAVKHAFPTGAGIIRVELKFASPESIALVVKDDGIGIEPERAEINAGRSIGLQLIRTLAEQVGGAVRIDGGAGTTVTLEFPVGPLADG